MRAVIYGCLSTGKQAESSIADYLTSFIKGLFAPTTSLRRLQGPGLTSNKSVGRSSSSYSNTRSVRPHEAKRRQANSGIHGQSSGRPPASEIAALPLKTLCTENAR